MTPCGIPAGTGSRSGAAGTEASMSPRSPCPTATDRAVGFVAGLVSERPQDRLLAAEGARHLVAEWKGQASRDTLHQPRRRARLASLVVGGRENARHRRDALRSR